MPTGKRVRLDPLYLERAPKRDSYLYGADMVAAARAGEASRIVRYRGQVRSFQQSGGGWVKALDRFAYHHAGREDTWREFLGECKGLGVQMPSSYATVFRHLFPQPRIPWSINAALARYTSGGWEEAREKGFLPGVFHQYDMNRAYRWAARQGLPDPKRFVYSDRISAKTPGLYVIELRQETLNLTAPYPFNRPGWIAATDAEIEEYNLTPHAVRWGILWRGTWGPDAVEKVLERVTFSDDMQKSFWGGWAAQDAAESYYPDKGTIVPGRPITLNLVWAHFIISQVKRAVYEKARGAVHVFVDSIITPFEFPTSNEVGGWKKVTTFENGLFVGGAGRYGRTATDLLKHVGTSN